jgi:hypothetical protein
VFYIDNLYAYGGQDRYNGWVKTKCESTDEEQDSKFDKDLGDEVHLHFKMGWTSLLVSNVLT